MKIDGDHFKNCRPRIVNPKTKKVEPVGSPVMRAVDRIWALTTHEERMAFHRVTCLNSRDPEDMLRFLDLSDRVRQAIAS